MKTKIQLLKEELKKLATGIRNQKVAFKNAQREIGNSNAYIKFGYKLTSMASEFRHKHIAYCLLRGRTMEQIENTNRDGNEPDQGLIDAYYDEYYDEDYEEYKDEAEALHTDET